MNDLSGQDIGRYHILEPLGEGGMAKVYKAFDTHLENEVAVKVIRTDQLVPAMLEKTLKRFEREAKEVAKLSHPNIMRVIDYGEHDGMPYLVMQYLHGGTLKKLLGSPMPYQQAAALLVPIARALDYAHQHKMVHRDVKPSNILITDSGEPMLTDFGIVKMLDVEDGATLTGTGVGLGTPEYMAPEQWMGDFSPSVDQYSLGVVFYELVTGHKPYSADTPAAVLLKQASDPLPRPGNFISDLPDNVEHVMLKALAKNPADRYANMGELANALQRLERDNEIEVEKTIQAAIPPVPPLVKKEPVVEKKDTSATVMEAKPVTPKPEIPVRPAVPETKAPVQAFPKFPAKKLKPWVFVLGGVGVLVVLGVILGITQGWFSPAKPAAPEIVPTKEVQTGNQPVVSPTQSNNPQATSPTKVSTLPSAAQKSLKVCLVTDTGGIDDKSFNASIWNGVKIAEGKLNIEARYIQSTDVADFEKNITNFANSGCGLVIGTGWQLAEPMAKIAGKYPNTMFTGVDFEFNPSLANTVGQVYQTDQAAFLAGYLAAGMSKSGKVGEFGGMNIPTVTIFMDGFARGVEYFNKQHQTNVQVIGWSTSTLSGLMVDSFSDVEIGKKITKDLISQGADVIFPVAGPVGVGSAEAIQEHGGGIWMIGVDSDWTQTQPQYASLILTSVLKNMDITTYSVIEELWAGKFSAGNFVGNLANGGVGIATPNSAVQGAILLDIELVKQDIISGKIQLNSVYHK